MAEQRQWIEPIELENVNIKWGWSNFDGNDNLNGPGTYNFVAILPEQQARELQAMGFSVKENPPYEEGDAAEFTMKINISDKFELPKIYFLMDGRKFQQEKLSDLSNIRRDTLEQLDVIFTPSFWERPNGESGVTAYLSELYAQIRPNRFWEKYKDYEDA